MSASGLYGQGESLLSETPDTIFITCKYKRKKTPDTYIIRKQPIQGPFNPRKGSKENNLTDVEKNIPKETLPKFRHKVD